MLEKIKQFFLFWKIDRHLALKYRQQRNDIAKAYASTIRNILRHDTQEVIDRRDAHRLLELLERID